MPPLLVLFAIGTAWGLTIPVTKIAVSTGHDPLGLLAWQTVLMSVIMTVVMAVRGQRLAVPARTLWLVVFVAVFGTLLPNSVSYRASSMLPAGIMAIIIAIVPLFAWPIALALGLERLRAQRALGLGLGFVAIVMIAGPEASLPGAADAGWVLFALLAPLCYGLEGNVIALRRSEGLDPVTLLWGSSLVGAVIAVPAAVLTGHWIPFPETWTMVEAAVPAISALHAFAYTGYVWLVARAGAVFAAQVAYLVTATGVIWSMAILGERYSPWVWAAFAVMLAGVALVQPRRGHDSA